MRVRPVRSPIICMSTAATTESGQTIEPNDPSWDRLTAQAAPKKEEGIDPSKPVSFYKHIRPILQANCTGCHQPAKPLGGYVTTDHASLLKIMRRHSITRPKEN